jgi:hypothetical protein
LTWRFELLRAYRTIGKCPALRLVSRFYRSGYNALAVCFDRLVLAVMLPLLPSLDPLLSLFAQRGQAFQLQL